MGEKGSYTCQWKNNFLGQTNYRNFTVSYPNEIPVNDKTVVTAVSSTFSVLLLILIAYGGVKFYRDKVRIYYLTSKIFRETNRRSFLCQPKETTSFTRRAT
jgi:hypothetical protein